MSSACAARRERSIHSWRRLRAWVRSAGPCWCNFRRPSSSTGQSPGDSSDAFASGTMAPSSVSRDTFRGLLGEQSLCSRSTASREWRPIRRALRKAAPLADGRESRTFAYTDRRECTGRATRRKRSIASRRKSGGSATPRSGAYSTTPPPVRPLKTHWNCCSVRLRTLRARDAACASAPCSPSPSDASAA